MVNLDERSINLDRRLGIILNLVKQRPKLGKTAVMKFVFLLQQIFKAPLGYNFEIYTYGPYAAEVMEDIELAKNMDFLLVNQKNYSDGINGYELELKDERTQISEDEKDFVNRYEENIKTIVDLFGNRTAKELELLATIVYMYISNKFNGWDSSIDYIAKDVHEIKPHFNIESIKKEYTELNKLGLLEK